MAKITPSALITAIRGKLRGDCFQVWKGEIILRRSPRPKPITKFSAQSYKGWVSTLSACHYKLTDDQKTGWNCYSELLPTAMSGYNAFMARNTAIVLSCHPSLCIYFNAPSCYSPPVSPSPVGLCYYACLNVYCLFWTTPNCTEIFVQGFMSVQTGYSNQHSPSWRLFKTVESTLLRMDFDAVGFPADLFLRFTARSINKRGEISILSAAVPPPPLPGDLYVTFPWSGYRLYIGSNLHVGWRSVSIDNIKIDYSINGGTSWIEITPSTPADKGWYPWTIPDNPTSQGKVRISNVEAPTMFSESPGFFTIMTKPTLALTAPNGGEEWQVATKENITWTSTGVTNVDISYSINNGDSFTDIVEEYPAASGSYEWTIPDDVSDECLVKIYCREDYKIHDTSDSVFSIIPSQIPSSCVAYWFFKTAYYDSENSRFTDQSGNGHHAENNNGVVGEDYTTMNGTTAYFKIDDFMELSADRKKFSVAIWLNGADQNCGIICHDYSLAVVRTCAWYIYSFTGQNPSFAVSHVADATTSKWYKISKTVMNSQTHLIGLTFNNDTFKIWIDGVLDSEYTVVKDDSFDTIFDSEAEILISKRPESGDEYSYFSGKLYKAFLFNDELTQAEWTALFNMGA